MHEIILLFCMCVKVKSLSRVWLCDPMDWSLLGSSVHGILQARILESVAISLNLIGLVIYISSADFNFIFFAS